MVAHFELLHYSDIRSSPRLLWSSKLICVLCGFHDVCPVCQPTSSKTPFKDPPDGMNMTLVNLLELLEFRKDANAVPVLLTVLGHLGAVKSLDIDSLSCLLENPDSILEFLSTFMFSESRHERTASTHLIPILLRKTSIWPPKISNDIKTWTLNLMRRIMDGRSVFAKEVLIISMWELGTTADDEVLCMVLHILIEFFASGDFYLKSLANEQVRVLSPFWIYC